MNLSMDSGVVLNERYRLLRQLGHSSVGCTYLVEDTHRFNELCVIKKLIPQLSHAEQLQKIEELFEREAKVLYKLQHPQIPRFRELFRLQNHLFLVQDYIQGQTYRDILSFRQLQGQVFTEEEITQFLKHILPVLAYIHARGIIHRDISPDNIILRHSDQLPVLIDFGSVKQLATTGTQPGSTQPVTIAIATQLGQMGYAPPEQIQNGLVYPHSDLYALAATVLTLLTGKQPAQILEPHSLSWDWKRDLVVSSKLKNLLISMLAKNVSDRPQSTREVLEILNQAQAQSLQPAVITSQPTQATLVVAQLSSTPVTTGSSVATSPTPVPSSVPSSPTPPQLNSVSLSQDNSTMTSTSTRPSNFLHGCLGKLTLVLLLSIGSGMMGWLAGKTWLDQITQNNTPSESSDKSTTVFTDNPSSSGISDQEWKRKNEIQSRRLNLGIDSQFFYNLVDQLFQSEYPAMQGKILTNKPEDDQWREKWDKIAADLLDKLSFLSPKALKDLGKYTQAQRNLWIQEANRLHLSSRALYDLADGTFFYYFPEQKNQEFITQPIGQVWNAIIFDRLETMRSGKFYEKLNLSESELETQSNGRLEPGEGNAYVIRLNASETVKIALKADNKDTLFSIYSPTGKNNLLEDSQEHQWSGELPENGFYEITIVSQSKKPLDYQLTISFDNSFLKPRDY
ncbi:serine/threonine protein kinase [Gloeothece citriformis PCC 7424]|uniref:non-specific serine/threonine protein kinase n=1 Tax=Gloeothece citriformis (strain PCC 7424) TaxID=65393 RepID=B7KAK1_GLOC7|nr:serine/threonine-protein kinase [Gloeothece citriformis]ACK68673.1 serine/threonine protein kinase [Gloeothece citriformis PCC 7424]